ncbi:hypothetical protein [Parasedimentitalea maritima]|uniref:Uncharacterized protein n=1 Tax=Parasedimentitalea maritima TaxID=2578117 RepID=A0A6A4RGJ8_9RHOB|nr:hypothetical protein [Zongyanglinia marina]KAE9630041.1 hypothetical protein GP644_10145 [Zongyanglinia marina]
MIARLVTFFGDDRYKRLRWRLLLLVLFLIVLADVLVPRPHVEHVWDAIPGWSAAFGFISCVAIIFISKFIGHSGGIMRDEDYYD